MSQGKSGPETGTQLVSKTSCVPVSLPLLIESWSSEALSWTETGLVSSAYFLSNTFEADGTYSIAPGGYDQSTLATYSAQSHSGDYFGLPQLELPTNVEAEGLLSEIGSEQDPSQWFGAAYTGGSLGLDVYQDVTYTQSGSTTRVSVESDPYYFPGSALYLFGSALDLGTVAPGAFVTGSEFGIDPSTNDMTPNGLPSQEATALGNMADNSGRPDGVSRSAPPSPTATLIALAAAGRNPTDITLPTAGSQAVDPPPGSHEEPVDVIRPGDVPAAPLTPLQATDASQPAMQAQLRDWWTQIGAARAEQQRQLARAQAAAYAPDPALAAAGAVLPGLAQGAANTVNGVQDAAIGTGNLAVRGVNAVAGYRVLDERVSPDWSLDLIVSEGETAHNVSKFLGGNGAITLATAGLGAAAAGSGAAASQTGTIVVQAEGGLAVAAAGTAATPATAVAVGCRGVGAIGRTVQMSVGNPGGNAPIPGGGFNPADFAGKQAVVSPHLKAGTYPALVVDGEVYVARMHITAWELAGKQGVEQFYGFAEIDAAGNVVRLFK